MNAEQRRLASKMWKDGELVTVIAKEFGVKVNRIYQIADRHRYQFPHRQFTTRRREKDIPPPPAPVTKTDRMQWLTEDGAFVTLPKISFIECPRITA